MKIILTVLMLFSSYVLAASDWGQELQIERKPQTPQGGELNLGVHYSYDPGFTGEGFVITWGILYKTTISPTEMASLPATLRWNVYDSVKKVYLAPWDEHKTIMKNDLLLGSVSAEGSLAEEIIGRQARVILVFADEAGKALYFLNVGGLCKSAPNAFVNLTDASKRCDQVTVADIEKEKAAFCAESRAELLDFVSDGTIACSAAAQKYQKMGCGNLGCR